MSKSLFKIPTGTRESRIKQNVAHRQALKKKWDKKCKYGVEAEADAVFHSAAYSTENFDNDKSDNYVRLLDEGVVVDGGGWAYAVIAKGTLKAWYDNLSNNFKGKINKDHCDAIDLGTFSKKDLRLVELGNDRYGIDVNVKLDDNLYAVKDLKRMMNRKALSSEFYWDAEQYVTAEAATGDEKQGKWLIPIINQIQIDAYAVVDNPKNANSYDENLLEKASAQEGNEMDEEEKKRLEAEKAAAEAEANEAADESDNASEADATDEGTGEGADADKTEAGAEEGDNTEDGADEGKADEDKGEEDEGDKTEAGAEDEITLEKLAAAVESLKADNKAKDDEIAKLKAQIAGKDEEAAEYKNKLTELFKFATTDEPTDEEGADNSEKTPESETKANEDAYEAALENAFKAMEG